MHMWYVLVYSSDPWKQWIAKQVLGSFGQHPSFWIFGSLDVLLSSWVFGIWDPTTSGICTLRRTTKDSGSVASQLIAPCQLLTTMILILSFIILWLSITILQFKQPEWSQQPSTTSWNGIFRDSWISQHWHSRWCWRWQSSWCCNIFSCPHWCML